MICKDCIHYPVCKAISNDTTACNHFKDKSRTVELPCKVGDEVYKPIITDNTKKPAIHTIVATHIDVDINNRGVTPSSFVVGRLKNTRCGEAFDFDEIGKTVFLTREEAEEALRKEREK